MSKMKEKGIENFRNSEAYLKSTSIANPINALLLEVRSIQGKLNHNTNVIREAEFLRRDLVKQKTEVQQKIKEMRKVS